MTTLENGKNNTKSSRRGISFEFQSRDLPSRRLLGKGLSGIGYETAWKGARYARKDFVGVQRDILLQEATVLVGLKEHKNIVKTYGWTVDKRSCSLVLEYMDEDLLSFLQKRMDSKRGVVGIDLGKQSSTFTSTQPFDLPEAVDMMLQIATGVEYLHEQGLAHGDLKTKNILVTRRKDGDPSSKVVKLSDFGLVGTKRKSKYIVSRKVRKLDMVRWKSPECLKILSRRLHSSNGDGDETSSESESDSTPSSVPEVTSACAGIKSSDVYSFALICSQILTGHSPYPDLAWKELMVRILSGWRPAVPVSCHPVLRDLLISCWGDVAERPSFSAVCMKLKRVQGLLTTAVGKRPHEAAAPSVTDSPAHEAAVVPSAEVSRSSGNCLSPKPLKGPAIVPSEWTASLATMRSNAPGVPSAASSAPSPPATAGASSAADESYVESRRLVGVVPSSEPTQSEDLIQRLEEALLRDSVADTRVKKFSDLLVTTSSDLNNDPIIGRGSNLAGTSLLKKFIENRGSTSRICDTSATEVKTGTMDIGNDLVPSSASLLQSSFKAWRNTCVLCPTQQKGEKSKNQWLLRRSLEILPLQWDLQQGIQTHGAVSETIGSRSPPTSAMSMSPGRADKKTIDFVTAERRRRTRLNEKFTALRRLVPIISKNDKVSTLGDAMTYLQDLKSEIHGLEAIKNQVERQFEDLKLSHQDLEQRNQQLEASKSMSHQDLEQRNQQLEASKSKVERQYQDLILSHQDLEQRNQQLEASKSKVERQYQDLILSHQDLEQRNQQLEASKSKVERQYQDLILSHQDLEQRNKLLEAWKSQVKNEYEEVKSSHWNLEQLLDAGKNQVKNEYEEVKLSDWDLEDRNKQLGTIEEHLPTVCQKDEPK